MQKRIVVAFVIIAAAAAAVFSWWPRASAPGRPALRALPAGGGDAASSLPRDQARVVRRAFDPAGDPLGWVFEPGVPGRVLAGRVLNADGTPAAGARVLCTPLMLRGLEPWAAATADATGAFALGELPAGRWWITAALGDAATRAIVDSDDPRATPAPDALELRLEACAEPIAGVVVDHEARPIAGARIANVGPMGQGRLVVTGVDGRFTTCEDGFLEATAEGFAPERVPVSRGGADVIVRLLPAATIEGRVVDAGGRPVHGARVADRGIFSGVDAVTDEAGGFSIAVRPGPVTVWAEWRGRSAEATLTVGPRGHALVEIVLPEDCRRLAGHVVAGGAPLAGARIGPRPAEEDEPGVVTYTDAVPFGGAPRDGASVSQADGSFVLGCAPTTAFELVVRDVAGAVPLLVPEGQEAVDDLLLKLPAGAAIDAPPAGAGVGAGAGADAGAGDGRATKLPPRPEDERPPPGTAVGLVVDEAGAPVAGAWVASAKWGIGAAITGDDGRFELPTRSAGLAGDGVRAVAPDGRSGVDDEPGVDGAYRVVLSATRGLALSWRGAGEPSGPYRVNVQCEGWNWTRVVLGTSVAVEGVPVRGDCRALVIGETHFGNESFLATARELVVPLDAYGEIVGLVVWPEDGAVPEEPVRCAAGGVSARAGADGVFRLRGLVPSTTTVQCRTDAKQHDPGEHAWAGEFDLELGSGEQRVDVYMAPDVGQFEIEEE